MNLKTGDKVKFLNTKGGGVVRKVIDTRMVVVEIEGGFEIPTLISELVRIDTDLPGGRFFDESFAVKPDEGPVEPVLQEDDRMLELSRSVTVSRKSEDIFLAFVPHDQKWLITGLLDIYLINNTSSDLLYNFIRKTDDGRYTGIDYGSVFPDSRLLIGTIEREEIGKWTDGYLQFLFHKNTPGELLPPFNSEVVIKGTKFFTEASYRESPLIEGKGIVVKIVSLTDCAVRKKNTEEDKVSAMQQGSLREVKDLIFKHKSAPGEAEVDLHIQELLEDPSRLENSEILEFQKNYFIRCLENAISNHFRKVTFIHGVGNGILRECLLDLLKEYRGTEVFDAPMQKYGVGAIEVRIRQNQ
jgi:hypothetical protein